MTQIIYQSKPVIHFTALHVCMEVPYKRLQMQIIF
jgi:hypothetical protein